MRAMRETPGNKPNRQQNQIFIYKFMRKYMYTHICKYVCVSVFE